MSTEDLRELLETGGAPRVAVVGDLVLDRYTWGRVERISPEAPIQVLAVDREEERLGGAANVARNLAVLGADVRCVGAVGADPAGGRLAELLAAEGIPADHLVRVPDRPTTVKTRMIAHAQQVLRVDHETTDGLGAAETAAVAVLGPALAGCAVAVLSDYAKGFLSPGVVAEVVEQARAAGAKVLVDPKGTDYARYRGAWALTPNRREAEAATGLAIRNDVDLPAAADRLLEIAQCEAAVITLGEGGVYLRTRDGRSVRKPARARSVYDVTGAGDTVIAVLAWTLAQGADWPDALEAANAAAGVAVGQVGAVAVTRRQVLAELYGGQGSPKVVTRAEAQRRLQAWRAAGRRVAFTNGCYDLLHAGHVGLLDFARGQADALVVAVNSDDSVRRLKGPHRPIVDERARVAVLAALECVDLVVVFDEDTPMKAIEALRPDVLVKGEDYRGKEVVGGDFVESYGGRVVLAPLLEGFSTTRIVDRIRKGFH